MSTGSFLVRAIACIKPVTPAAEAAAAAAAVPGAPQQLEPDQNPVVDLLGNGLMVVYLVDEATVLSGCSTAICVPSTPTRAG